MNDELHMQAMSDMAYTAGVAHRAAGGKRPTPWEDVAYAVANGENEKQVWTTPVYAYAFDAGWMAEESARKSGEGTPCHVAGAAHRLAVWQYEKAMRLALAAVGGDE